MPSLPPLTPDQAIRLLVVLEALKMLVEQDSPHHLADALNARGFAPLSGERWTRGAVEHYAREAAHMRDTVGLPSFVTAVAHLARDDRAGWAAKVAAAISTLAKPNISIGAVAVGLDRAHIRRFNGEAWSGHYVRAFLLGWRCGQWGLPASTFDEAVGKYLRPAGREHLACAGPAANP